MFNERAGFGRLNDLVRLAEKRRRLGNASLLNAMVGETDDMKLDGIVIRCALVRPESGEATTATA
jgi:hypothetical protein